ncbi:hypothetical protein [Halobacteriovorax sp. RZ-2]|uniref:hypothetical protein n=1 Tax=unclassified Halobacteriovorax TaxID=2639665 RepID=UPI003724911A
MNRILYILPCLLCLMSCVEDNSTTDSNLKFREALLRSRNIVQVSRNIDQYNSLNLNFNLNFETQLVELAYSVKKPNNTVITLLNKDRVNSLEFKKNNSIAEGSVDILLNGTSIRNCLITECVETKCTGEISDNLEGLYSTENIYLNLQKIKAGTCGTVNMANGNNVVTFQHIVDPFGSDYQALNVKAKVITYNVSYGPKGVNDVFN